MKTILLIEDDSALRENTAELLEFSNYKCITAPNGSVGIEKAKSELPDLIICDIMMPEVDGYGVLEAVTIHPETQHIPFIFLSAKTEHKEIRKGMDLGADDYLTKPFEEEELLSAVESRLAKSELISKMFQNRSEEAQVEENVHNLNELKNFFDDHGKIFTFNKGETIYKKGQYATMIYLILKGGVKCHLMDESGKELTTTLQKADDFLGFTSLLEQMPYPETASAVKDVELAGISIAQLREILGKSKNVSMEFMNVLTNSLHDVKNQLLQMAYSSVRKKTATTLLQFAETLNRKPTDSLKISRYDLAIAAGIATESLIRTLSDFKKNGLIEIEGRNIKITNFEGLQAIE